MTYGVFAEKRTVHNPYLMGDVFVKDDKEFTLFENRFSHTYGLLKTGENLKFTVFKGVHDLLDQGFIPVQEYIEMGKAMDENHLYAPRQLKDGTWAALMPLAFTTSICVDFDDWSPFRTRYCFGHNAVLPSYLTALYWLVRMDNCMSLPVGNCAYRGHLGNQPILDDEYTKQYYQKMYDLKHNVMFMDDKDIHGVANETMIEVFGSMSRMDDRLSA